MEDDVFLSALSETLGNSMLTPNQISVEMLQLLLLLLFMNLTSGFGVSALMFHCVSGVFIIDYL